MDKISKNNVLNEPVFILEQSHSTRGKIFKLKFVALTIFSIFLGILCITTDDIKFKIGGLFFLFGPITFIFVLEMKKIICFDDFLIVKYPFWQSIFYYDDIRYYWHNFRMQTLQLFSKKRKFVLFMRVVFVSYYLFDKNDIKKFENFLESKNIYSYRFKLF